MVVRNLKELNCIVDMLIASVQKCDSIDINLTYSGVIFRGMDCAVEKRKVKDALAQIQIRYTESGVLVNSHTNKAIASWLSGGTPIEHIKTSSYLSFIKELYTAEISSIQYNGSSILEDLTTPDGNINICNLAKFVTASDTSISNLKIHMADATGKLITLTYVDDVFIRLVKNEDKHTLYINSGEYMRKLVNKNSIFGFMVCTGLPSIATQIKLFETIAEYSGCEFKVVTGSNRKQVPI